MMDRARSESLKQDHPMLVRARELHDAYEKRYLVSPPDCSVPHYIDCYARAYSAWHVHTGLDTV
jgi:hypothetical protein